jgi:hypothetical protein
MEENWKRIEKVIKKAADKTVSKGGNQRNKELFDEECAKAVLERRMPEKNATKRNKNKLWKVSRIRREANRMCKKKKTERMKRQLEDVNKFKDQNERRKFYKAIDNLKKGFQPRSNGCRNKYGEIIREGGKIL